MTRTQSKKRINIKLIITILVIVVSILFFIALFFIITFNSKEKNFAVLNALEGKDYKKAENYSTVVIDPDNFSYDELNKLKSSGTLTYAYINVGALETFRDYYEDFKQIKVKKYEGFDDEFFVDVTDLSWQEHIINLCNEALNEGYDGFFLDNIDVYEETGAGKDSFDALSKILLDVKSIGLPVILNGGKAFVEDYIESGYPAYLICDGIAQEEVFSSYDPASKKYKKSDASSRKEYLEYLDARKSDGTEIYLIEYTKNPFIKFEAMYKATSSNWNIYVTDSIELK